MEKREININFLLFIIIIDMNFHYDNDKTRMM